MLSIYLIRIMNNDSVYKVQDAAFRKLKNLGEDVQLPQRKKGEFVKDINKILLRIKKSLPEGHTFEEFKEKVKKMRLDVYDTYEGNKGLILIIGLKICGFLLISNDIKNNT